MKKIGGTLAVALLAFVLVLSPMGTAMADNQKGLYIGVFGGYLIPDDLELDSGGAELNLNLDNGWMAGARVGYIFPAVPYVAVELEYNYMSEQDMDVAEVKLGDVKLNNLFGNVIFRYPGEWIRPYFGAGIGWSWIKLSPNELFTADTGIGSESDNNWAWQLMLGVNFAFQKNWSADIGYRYFNADNFTLKIDATNVDAKYSSSIITAGVNYHF